jgi:hypothetical protein
VKPPAGGPVWAVRWTRAHYDTTEPVTRLFRQRHAAEGWAKRKAEAGQGPVGIFRADLGDWREVRRS